MNYLTIPPSHNRTILFTSLLQGQEYSEPPFFAFFPSPFFPGLSSIPVSFRHPLSTFPFSFYPVPVIPVSLLSCLCPYRLFPCPFAAGLFVDFVFAAPVAALAVCFYPYCLLFSSGQIQYYIWHHCLLDSIQGLFYSKL